MSRTRIYRLWTDMLTRALNPCYKQAKDYSGRGITVVKRWRVFENFLEDMGQPPSSGHSIERRDNDKGYSKDNCYWATKKQQARNTRTNRLITIGDETYCVAEWAERRNIRKSIVYDRLYAGWTPEEALGFIQRTKGSN